MPTFSIQATVEADTLDGAIVALVAALKAAGRGAGKPDTSGKLQTCSITKQGKWTFRGGTSTTGTIRIEQ